MLRYGRLLRAVCLAAAGAGCSTQDSVSTPVISGLTLTASTVPGGSVTGTFFLMNAAGVGSLSLHLTLTDSTGGMSPPEVQPLSVSGAASQGTASASVQIGIPSTGPTGTYSVTIAVSDGADTSNALSGTFKVD